MLDLIKKIVTIFRKPKVRIILFWSTLFFIMSILLLCFLYSDILITTKHSANLLQAIFSGHPLDFYKLNYGLVVDRFLPVATAASYEIPIFIVFAIWDIPIWIAQNLFHIQITYSLICLIWIKLMLVMFLCFCAWVVNKLCIELGINKSNIKWVIFTFVSSPLLLIPLFIMGQYDIIAILFILLGILMYLRGNLKWFVIWFAIAITLKMFAIFVFIPLILLNNKKILNIIKYLFIGLLPLVITKAASIFMPMYSESTSSFSGYMMTKLFSIGIAVNFGGASLFCMALIGISIFCYMKKIKDKQELGRFVMYIPLAVFASFFMFVEFYPYWIILITPFIAIVLFQNMKNFKINIILDIISSTSIILMTMMVYFWCYGPLVIERMLLPRLFGSTNNLSLQYPTVLDFLSRFGVNKLAPLLLAIYISCVSAILVINFPRKGKINKKNESDNHIEWGLLFLRMLIIVPVAGLIIFCYFYVK